MLFSKTKTLVVSVSLSISVKFGLFYYFVDKAFLHLDGKSFGILEIPSEQL